MLIYIDREASHLYDTASSPQVVNLGDLGSLACTDVFIFYVCIIYKAQLSFHMPAVMDQDPLYEIFMGSSAEQD